MTYAGFRFTGRFAVQSRPEDRPPAVEGDTWAKDKVGGVGGTEADATWFNRTKANLENFIVRLGGDLNGGDDQMANAIEGALNGKADVDHDHDDLYYREVEVDALLATVQPIDAKGIANGYAGLDGSGKVPTSQLPDAVLGAMSFQGFWDAATNSPALASGAGTKGHYYIVDTAGATTLDGVLAWAVGDWAVFDGAQWGKIDNTDAVSSVAGLTGAVSGSALKAALGITAADVGAVAAGDVVNNLTTSDAAKPLSAAQGKSLKDQFDAFVGAVHLPRGHLHGLTLANNAADATNDIDIAAGCCRSDDDSDDMVLSASITKRLDAAWAVGSGSGGRDTGSIADSTWHVWLIKRTDTGIVDVLLSLSATAPTMPANYTKKRRIGSVIRASSALRAFVQTGDEVLLKALVADVSVNNLGTSATSYALSVPAGISVEAIFTYRMTKASTAFSSLIYSPLLTDDTPDASTGKSNATTVSATIGGIKTGEMRVRTNTSREVRAVSTEASTTLNIATRGWVDTRGRLA